MAPTEDRVRYSEETIDFGNCLLSDNPHPNPLVGMMIMFAVEAELSVDEGVSFIYGVFHACFGVYVCTMY